MKLLHCADLHLGCSPEGNEVRFADYCACLTHACDTAIAHGADAMLIAGDLFHQRAIDPRTLHAAVRELSRLKDAGISCIAIEGNHDKAFYTMRQSWMEYLDATGLLFLLKPVYADAQPHLVPYAEGKGCILTLGDVRFVGFGYLGASTRARLQGMQGELPPTDGFTVGLLHSGVDNLRGLDMGAVSSADLTPWRDTVDYLALGHVHTRWENGWAFNPGAPENVHLGESRRGEKGFYWLETGQAHCFHATFLPANARPARYYTLDVTGLAPAALPEAALTACAGTQPDDLLLLTLTGASPTLADTALLKETLHGAYAPLLIELRDETHSTAQDTARSENQGTEALERSVMAQLAVERGLDAAGGDAALALCDALMERQSPEGIYRMLEGYLAAQEGEA